MHSFSLAGNQQDDTSSDHDESTTFQELEEIVEGGPKENSQKLVLGFPYNVKQAKGFKQRPRYFEIQACLNLLKKTKNEMPSFVHLQACRQKLLDVYRWVCIVTMPSAAFSAMYVLHSQLAEKIQQKLTPLLAQVTDALFNYNTFLNWYDREFCSSGVSIEETSGTLKRFNMLCPTSEMRVYLSKPYGTFQDFCQYRENRLWKNFKFCTASLFSFCFSEKAYFKCMDAKSPEQQNYILEFRAPFYSNATALREEVDHLNTSIAELHGQSTWEPISTTLFSLTSVASAGYLFYLIKNFCKAKAEFEHEFKESLPLHQSLDAVSFLRLQSLIVTLNVPCKDLTFEKLIDELQKCAQRYEHGLTFFGALRAYSLPHELVDQVMHKVDLIEEEAALKPKM